MLSRRTLRRCARTLEDRGNTDGRRASLRHGNHHVRGESLRTDRDQPAPAAGGRPRYYARMVSPTAIDFGRRTLRCVSKRFNYDPDNEAGTGLCVECPSFPAWIPNCGRRPAGHSPYLVVKPTPSDRSCCGWCLRSRACTRAVSPGSGPSRRLSGCSWTSTHLEQPALNEPELGKGTGRSPAAAANEQTPLSARQSEA